MLNYNEQITVYTSDYIELNGKFITIGDDIENFYYATSFQLHDFKLKNKIGKKPFAGKLILVNIQRYLDNQFNDATEAPIINIVAGKVNEEIDIPVIEKNKNGIADPSIVKFTSEKKKIPAVVAAEIFFPSPTILIGGGIDFIGNSDRKGNALSDLNRLIPIEKAGTETLHYLKNPFYSIVPTQ